jgi:HEAT repeat protein
LKKVWPAASDENGGRYAMKSWRWRLRTLVGLVVVAALGIKGVMLLRAPMVAVDQRHVLKGLIHPPRPAYAEATLVAALADPYLRRTATWALVKIDSNSPALVPVLVAELEVQTELSRHQNRWDYEQVYPAQALKRMKLPAAVIAPLLRKAMASKDSWIRLQATLVLCDAAGRPGPPDSILPSLLLSALQDQEASVRMQTPEALARLDVATRRQAVTILLGQLRGTEPFAQFLATIGLARFDPEGGEAVAILADRLQSGDLAARLVSLYLLGRLGPLARPAVPAIVRAMTSPDALKQEFFFMRRFSPGMDGFINVEGIPDSGEKHRTPSRLCPLGADVLGKIGPEADRQAVDVLLGMLRLEDESQRLRAGDALGALGPRASAVIPTLLELAERERSDWLASGPPAVWRLLGALKQVSAGDDPRLVAALLRMLKSTNSTQRCGAANIFEGLDPPSVLAVPALIEALRDDAQAVRGSAAHALGRYDGPERKAAVAALLDALEEEEDEYVRMQAAKSLAHYREGSVQVVPEAVRLLRSKNPSVRMIASQILGEFGPEAALAVPALLETRHDPMSYVRDAVEKALKAILPSEADPASNDP